MNICRRFLKTRLSEILSAVQKAAPAHRAVLFDAISDACHPVAPDLSLAAKRAAGAIREAEELQKTFRRLVLK
jgi:hypothetical protein